MWTRAPIKHLKFWINKYRIIWREKNVQPSQLNRRKNVQKKNRNSQNRDSCCLVVRTVNFIYIFLAVFFFWSLSAWVSVLYLSVYVCDELVTSKNRPGNGFLRSYFLVHLIHKKSTQTHFGFNIKSVQIRIHTMTYIAIIHIHYTQCCHSIGKFELEFKFLISLLTRIKCFFFGNFLLYRFIVYHAKTFVWPLMMRIFFYK